MTAMTEARATGTAQVNVPDISDFRYVPIIEILVKEGDTLNAEDSLLTLKSDTRSSGKRFSQKLFVDVRH
jgi:pyruvate dehydrogenase E2 component (dihydrolipoamide acetyltransferase)